MADRTTSYWDTLDIGFEGYFLCRLTTDPDPTDEKRGVSGYTLALATENDLDNWLQLNPSQDYLERNLREPARSMLRKQAKEPANKSGTPIKSPLSKPIDHAASAPQAAGEPGRLGINLFEYGLGVSVTSARVKGRDYIRAQGLIGGEVNLLSERAVERERRPTFEGRNDIVGSDDNVEFAIDPFIIEIKPREGADPIHIKRKDVLPADRPIWQLPADSYSYRVGRTPATPEPILEVLQAIGVYDPFEYFWDRSNYLHTLLKQAQDAGDQDAAEMYRTRLYAIDFFGERIRSRLGMQRLWNFSIQGSTGTTTGLPEVDCNVPWPISFWLGGFDGDLLIGYMRGKLHLPLIGDGNR